MTIIRVEKNKNNPYVILNKLFLEDPNISLRLKGLMAYCLSKPDNWKFHIRQLASVLKEGKSTLYSIINEGIENGYISREDQKNDKTGRFEGVDYVIYETKIKENSTVSRNPDAVNPCPENQDTESRTLLINNLSDNDKEEVLGANAPKPPSPASPKRKRLNEPMVEVAPRVFLSASQQDALKKRLEGSKIELSELTAHLSDWKIGKQITGGSGDFSAIIKWVIDAVKQSKQTQSTSGGQNKPLTEADRRSIRDGERSERVRHDRDWSRLIEKKFNDQFKSYLIRSSMDKLEFNMGDRGGVEVCEFGSPGFRERCIKYLRSLNLDTSGV